MESSVSGSYHLRQLVKPLRCTTSQFAFPDHYDTPAQDHEGSLVPIVAGAVALKFCSPAVWVSSWNLVEAAAVMGVPKAPVDEKGYPLRWEN
jgi:hypothetical protein